MNAWIIILSLFSLLGFVLSTIFFFKKEEFNKLFAILIFMFAFNVFFNILFWSQLETRLYAFFHMSYFVPLSLYGGLFYLYLRSIVSKKPLTKKDAVHFIPFLFVMVLHSGFYFLKPSIKYQVFSERRSLDYIIQVPYLEQVLVLLLLIYTIVIYQKFKGAFKNDKELNLWVHWTIIGFIGFTLSFIVYEILMLTGILKVEHDYMITICSAIFIGIISYLVNIYPAVFNGKSIKDTLPFVKYKKTGLRKEESSILKEKLEEIIATERPYLNCDLRLMHLAQMLEIPRHHASQVINEHYNTNFFDFINHYRVKESEKLLKTEVQHYTMESIAYQSGFNNKVSFYKAFKRFNGVTPTVYRDQNA
ncbi:helix-turn-helix domain-containing protein [Flavobacteriaceae bacterium S356]|uniref:Helix-turn-helix domain-containing protein n=1 Tax=Asprobacillus argus TaxID=3076534 RepID=A0ABU3LDW6_9FLAO|nr:helix-turn-helix domain-containing protein [Flavobacteriaceae bacterium S356]